MYKKLIVVAMLFVGLLVYNWGSLSESTPGSIIIINGTSSSGKTSLAQALHTRAMKKPFTVIIGDDFVAHLSIPEDVSRDEANFRANSAILQEAKKLALTGKNIFVDTVEFDSHYQEYCDLLDDVASVKVLVYCPLDVLVARVERRGVSGDPRPLNLSFWQFRDMYKLQEHPHEMIVDCIPTIRMQKALEQAEQEIVKLMRDAGVAEDVFAANLKLFTQPFVEQFGLDGFEEIKIVPKHSWDLVVNCVNSPKKSAQTIVDYLKKINVA